MTAPVRTPRTPSSGSAAAAALKTFSLADIASRGDALPNRYGLHAGQGFGKTSLAAFAPSPVFVMTRGETGLTSLIDAGQLPETPHFPEIQSWPELLAAVKFLRTGEHKFKTLVLDTANGAERLMHEFVCDRDFDGEWGEKGFGSYQKGYEVALADWRMFENSLDDLRKERGMTIFMLLHTRIRSFKNPSGADYDRYTPEMHEKTWGLTKGWLDCILFGNFEVTVRAGKKVADASGKGKASEVSVRVLCTQSDNPIYDAKNRLGLPPEIEMGDSPEAGWKALSLAVKAGRRKPDSEPAPAAAPNQEQGVTDGQ